MLIIIAKNLIYKGILPSLNFCEETLQPKGKLFYIVKIFITFPSSASTAVYLD